MGRKNHIFSLPELKAHWWTYRIGRPPSSIRPSSSPQKPPGQSKSNFIWSLLGLGERKFAQIILVTWPRWPPCPYMVKTFKNLLLWNRLVDVIETWYTASGTRVLPSLLKWWPWVDLDLFLARFNMVPYAFVWEKVDRWSQLNEYMKLYEYQRSGSFIHLDPSQSDSIFSNFFSWITTKPIKAKFNVEPPWDGGMSICSNGPGHMTKMAVMPIYGQNL